MNIDTQLAVTNLFQRCMDISEAGRYHAFIRFDAHVSAVQVHVHPGDTDYLSSAPHVWLMNETVYLSGAPDLVLANINALTDRVCEFLLDHKEEAA